EIDTKALAYAQRHEGRCLDKVSPNSHPKFLEGLHLDSYKLDL
ncbi:16324_t:CDS:2, partial [Funneliformis caledonium]